MRKLKYLISSIFILWLLINYSFWYYVLIVDWNNDVVHQYNITDWTQEITLDWDWTKNWNVFTYNDSFDWTTVYYTDSSWQNKNVSLNSDIYINWTLSISYTWQQELFLTDSSLNCFETVYLPVFDVTWGITDVSTSWNIFNNFAENSVKFTLSNIPSYIQYVIIIMLLFFILGFIRKFKRR